MREKKYRSRYTQTHTHTGRNIDKAESSFCSLSTSPSCLIGKNEVEINRDTCVSFDTREIKRYWYLQYAVSNNGKNSGKKRREYVAEVI